VSDPTDAEPEGGNAAVDDDSDAEGGNAAVDDDPDAEVGNAAVDDDPDAEVGNAAVDDDPDAEVGNAAVDDDPDVPVWEDEYVDRVSDRLMFNYDLERGRRVRGESFTLYGRLEMVSRKQFFHPSITYGHHESYEHLFLSRRQGVTVGDLDRLVDLGHDLADDWIDADEEHYSTDFTFAVVVPEITADVRSFVSGFSDRTLLKYGYNGHYEIHLVVSAPDHEDVVASANTDVDDALRTWDRIDDGSPGPLERLKRRLF
jgi:hypothetical protein